MGRGELRVPGTIGLEGGAGLMGLPAVDLHDHGLVRPVGVDELALDVLVGEGEREAVDLSQLAEPSLKRGLGPSRLVGQVSEACRRGLMPRRPALRAIVALIRRRSSLSSCWACSE